MRFFPLFFPSSFSFLGAVVAWSNGQASIGGQRTPPPSVEKTTPPPGMQIYPRRNQPFLLERRFTKGLNSQQSNFQLKCLEYMRPVQKDLSKCWRIPHRPEKSLGRRILPLSTITPRRSEGFSPGEGGGGRVKSWGGRLFREGGHGGDGEEGRGRILALPMFLSMTY